MIITAETFAADQAISLDRAEAALELLAEYGWLARKRRDFDGNIVYGPGPRVLQRGWRYN